MGNEVMDIDQLNFDEEDYTQEEQTVEENSFGIPDNYSKEWMGGNNTQTTVQVEDPSLEEKDDEISEDILTYLLKEKGIKDPSQIKFEGENGEIETRDWNDLSLEEQYNILNTPKDTSDTDLDDQEIQLINQLRLRGITPEQFYELAKQQGVQEYTEQIQDNTPYVVDDFTDEELFLYDLKAKAEDMSDEELYKALEAAMTNESAFKKQTAGLREEYKKLEQEDKAQQQIFEAQQRQQEFVEFQNQIYDNIGTIQDIGGAIELEDEDKNLIAEFILGKDNAGISYLGKALNDPEKLIKMSWFALKGEEAFEDIQNYYAEQIKLARQNGYKEGLAAQGNPPTVKVQKPSREKKISAFSSSSYGSIDDLD